MHPKAFLATLSVAALCATASAPAFAGAFEPDFDWRDSEFSASSGVYGLNPTAPDGSVSHTSGDSDESTSYDAAPGVRGEARFIHDMTVGNVSTTVTIEAINPDYNGDWREKAVMTWDANDGIGITQKGGSGYNDYEADEIEGGNERLRFSFSDPVQISAIFVSDLFENEDYQGYWADCDDYDEWGYFRLNDDDNQIFRFEAGDSVLEDEFGNDIAGSQIVDIDPGNGELKLILPQAVEVTSIEFYADGFFCEQWKHGYCKKYGGTEFALAGVDVVQEEDVPEPGPLGILAIGLVGLGAARWRKARTA